MMDHDDDWNVHATPAPESAAQKTASTETPVATEPRWWRTASGSSLPGGPAPGRPWWEDPVVGSRYGTDPDQWLGIAMFKQALAGGSPLHVADFGGNCTVPPNNLVATLTEIMKLRPVRFGYGHSGVSHILLSSDTNMVDLNLSDGGRYANVSIASTDEATFRKVAKLCQGLLTHDNPKEGFVYALARGMHGFHLTRIGAAGTPLERGNYDAKVLEAYDHVVTDLRAESPCGRLTVLAGVPGCGKTYMVRSLLTDIPKAAFVLVPSHLVKELGSPELLPALMGAKHDGLSGPISLIIEDADKVLVAREAGDMAAISSLLNLGDGILGSVLDVRIIATTNAAKLEMDPATRRAGRLCRYIDVGTLGADQAEGIIRRLTGKEQRPNKDKRVALAEVYSHARELGWKPPPKVPPANPWANQHALDAPSSR